MSDKHHMTVRELVFILAFWALVLMGISWVLTAAGYLH